MKKNNFIKTFMQVFAILASIGGILFLCKDKIKACPCFSKNGCLVSLKEKFTRRPDVTDETEDTEEESDDDDSFLHAFDVDPASEREYVSLTINSSTKTETAGKTETVATTE